uniref:Retinoic acid receptor responder protein 2 n=1 Tax=Lates calcarifer TaxID=8187 RepID=A0A4W6FAE8_LATCA
MAAGLLLLVCAGAALYSAEAQEPYNELPDNFKMGVDLAFEQLNSHTGVQHHFRFLKSVEKSEIESGFGVKYLYHHFYLKPTRCPKGTTESNPQRCPFRNDRVSECQREAFILHILKHQQHLYALYMFSIPPQPLMDCAVCYKTAADQIEADPKPYVHCIQRPRLTEVLLLTICPICLLWFLHKSLDLFSF